MKKDRSFNIKITEEGEKMMKNLREKHNINTSSFLRSCIVKRYNELNGLKEKECQEKK